MGNRENRFRVLAVILSVLFFCAGIVLTLGIFLPIAGLAASHYALFAVGQRIFSVYGFSSFLIPLLFLYGAVLLLIPGWSRESKAVLLGVPLYFVTAIIGERLIYVFVPSVSIPLIRQFVTISILICALLLICFEIFLMLTLSEKLSGRRFSLRILSEEDTVSENNETKDGNDMEEADVTLSHSTPAAEKAPDLPKENPAESALPPERVTDEESVSPIHTKHTDDTAQEISATNVVSDTSSTDMEEAAFNPPPTADSTRNMPSANTAESLKDNMSDAIQPLPDLDTSVKTGISSIQNTKNEISQSEPAPSIQAEHTIEATNTEEDLPLLEKVEEEEQPLPLSTPLSAVMNMQEEEDDRPVFDPSDPNNLFTSLEEITAPVERIKQTDHSEVQSHSLLPEEKAAPIPPDMSGAAEQSVPQSSQTAAPETTEAIEQHHSENSIQDETTPSISSFKSSFSDEPVAPEDTASAASQMDSIPEEESAPLSPVESTSAAADSPTVAPPQSEPELPLVFVNGVPLPNERSDLLDTMVVIESESNASSKAIQETQSIPSETGEVIRNEADIAIDAAAIQDTAVTDSGDESVDVRIAEDDTETDIGAEALPDENIAEADIGINGFDTQDEEDTEDSGTEPDADTAFLETIEQAVPLMSAKPEPPPPPRKKYAIPFDLLTNYPDGEYWVVDDATRRSALMLKSTFNEFKIDVSITGIRKGPVVTMFEMLPSPGIKLSKITNLQDNIALRLAASSVRIVAPIPGKHAVGIEVPNKKRSIVSFRELIETDLPEAAKMAIPVALGKDVTGNPQVLDLAQTPHLLIAGVTGSGKSVCVNSIILSILYNRRPDEVKLILVDPKIVELKLYNDIAHLLTPVITEPKRAFQALQYALCEMERRYALLDNMGVRDIKTFNAKIKSERIATEELPYIVIIIDEFADLMATSGKELEATVARLCAMSRAVGIHLVLATQRPSIDVITGLIKANIPSRIAFMVASKTDSRIILDEMGAEKLLGKGDMLYVSAARPFPTRMQGAFVSEEEVERVVTCVKEYCEPEYIDDEIFVDDDDEPFDNAVFSDDNDPLYDQALEIVTFAGKASASYVQRKLKIGYNRAARLIEEMEARGIVGPANGSKPREVIRHG